MPDYVAFFSNIFFWKKHSCKIAGCASVCAHYTVDTVYYTGLADEQHAKMCKLRVDCLRLAAKYRSLIINCANAIMKIEPETISIGGKYFQKVKSLLHSMLQVCLYARNIIIIIFYLCYDT